MSLFALDVFGEGYRFSETILALLIHLIPSALLLVALIVAWRNEWLGGILFIGLGILFLLSFWEQHNWLFYLSMSGVLFLVGVLFLINSQFKSDLRPG
jgi:hypothetical protein